MIYLPERPFQLHSFLADVRRTFDQFGRCVVAVSEGIRDDEGVPIITRFVKRVERDAHGNIQLSGNDALTELLCDQVREKLDVNRVRGDTFGYLQRSFIGCVSDVDQREAREVGEKAVQYAMWGEEDGSVVIERTGYYSVDYRLAPLDEVAGKIRTMPDDFIAASGTDVTDAYRLYLRPLLGRSMPDQYRLRRNTVARILNRDAGD
jgi:6-phosphofructokinase 1